MSDREWRVKWRREGWSESSETKTRIFQRPQDVRRFEERLASTDPEWAHLGAATFTVEWRRVGEWAPVGDAAPSPSDRRADGEWRPNPSPSRRRVCEPVDVVAVVAELGECSLSELREGCHRRGVGVRYETMRTMVDELVESGVLEARPGLRRALIVTVAERQDEDEREAV